MAIAVTLSEVNSHLVVVTDAGPHAAARLDIPEGYRRRGEVIRTGRGIDTPGEVPIREG